MTIASTPNPSTAGDAVVISGTLFGPAATGATVVLWQKLPSQRRFHRYKQTSLDSAGGYRIALGASAVDTNREWYATAAGRRSVTLAESVRARVRLSVSGGPVRSGTPAELRGHVTPAHVGEDVVIQQRIAGGWRAIASVRVGHGSNYSFTHVFGRSGDMTLRAMLPADARNALSHSGVLTVRVRG